MAESSQVENTLRSQRQAWAEIVQSVSRIPSGELPMEAPKRILLFGVGSSYFAAKLTAFSLIRDKTRLRTPVIACNSMSMGNEVLPAKGDWAIAFSHRGRTHATNHALGLCERAGAFTVMATGQGVRVPEAARYVLTTSAQEVVEPHTVSVSGAICAVTTFLMGAKVGEEWDALRSLGDPDLDSLRRRVGKGPSILLGEWECEWLAREGALKFMEMAKLPVRAFGTEEYFHGPHFATRESDVIWHIAQSKDARTEELKAAQRIQVSGSSPLAWVPALIELQWMALAVSINLGVDPDRVKASR